LFNKEKLDASLGARFANPGEEIVCDASVVLYLVFKDNIGLE
jgi:hypothetical protein